MNATHQLAEFLVVAWRLGASSDRIPTSHGILDRALKKLQEAGDLPDWTSERLHFIDSRVGLQCVELPDILEWAQRAQLTTAPNPSYESTQVQISQWLAEEMVADLDMQMENIQEVGKRLEDAVNQAKSELENFEFTQIEEY
tara:strand:- start:2733 stop:3158 length:426 start_codon:yes stop_codon:yes gene_type:complete